jgi:hypothetical protein
MDKILTESEKKAYILKNWKLSSGKKISLMLQRFWNLHSEKSGEIPKSPEQISREIGLI